MSWFLFKIGGTAGVPILGLSTLLIVAGCDLAGEIAFVVFLACVALMFQYGIVLLWTEK